MQYNLSSNYNAGETDLEFLFQILDAGFVVFGFLNKKFTANGKMFTPITLEVAGNGYSLCNMHFYTKKELSIFAQERDLRYIKPLNLPNLD